MKKFIYYIGILAFYAFFQLHVLWKKKVALK